MVNLVFDATVFDLPIKKRVPINIKKQVEVSAEGMVIVLNLLQGLGYKATFICDPIFCEARPDLVAHAERDGHKMIQPDSQINQARVFVLKLSGITIQHLPIDVYKQLVKLIVKTDSSIVLPVWAFSEALYEPQYKVPTEYSRNCGTKLVQRVGNLILLLKKMEKRG